MSRPSWRGTLISRAGAGPLLDAPRSATQAGGAASTSWRRAQLGVSPSVAVTVALQHAFTRPNADAYLPSSPTQHTPSDINRAPVVYPVPAQAAPPVFTIVK